MQDSILFICVSFHFDLKESVRLQYLLFTKNWLSILLYFCIFFCYN